MAKQMRRAFGTIQYGHLDSERFESVEHYYEEVIPEICKDTRLYAGAFALEIGEKTDRVHIGFYIECLHPMRSSTLRNAFELYEPKHEAVFRTVRDAQGSWNYCVGAGRYEEKEAIDRSQFGEPTLYGAAEKVNLQTLITMVMDGESLSAIRKEHPYEYAVHRHRLHGFYYDYDRVLRGVSIGHADP